MRSAGDVLLRSRSIARAWERASASVLACSPAATRMRRLPRSCRIPLRRSLPAVCPFDSMLSVEALSSLAGGRAFSSLPISSRLFGKPASPSSRRRAATSFATFSRLPSSLLLSSRLSFSGRRPSSKRPSGLSTGLVSSEQAPCGPASSARAPSWPASSEQAFSGRASSEREPSEPASFWPGPASLPAFSSWPVFAFVKWRRWISSWLVYRSTCALAPLRVSFEPICGWFSPTNWFSETFSRFWTVSRRSCESYPFWLPLNSRLPCADLWARASGRFEVPEI